MNIPLSFEQCKVILSQYNCKDDAIKSPIGAEAYRITKKMSEVLDDPQWKALFHSVKKSKRNKWTYDRCNEVLRKFSTVKDANNDKDGNQALRMVYGMVRYSSDEKWKELLNSLSIEHDGKNSDELRK